MLYILIIDDYLKILTYEEVKDFVYENFSEYFKCTKETFYSKQNEKQNLGKVAKLLYVFLATPDEVEKHAKLMQSNSFDKCVHCNNIMILNLLDPELQLINTKTMIKNKLKKLPNELKKFKVQTVSVLQCKKRNDSKIFHLFTKLISSD